MAMKNDLTQSDERNNKPLHCQWKKQITCSESARNNVLKEILKVHILKETHFMFSACNFVPKQLDSFANNKKNIIQLFSGDIFF